jgi:hypothetical protein
MVPTNNQPARWITPGALLECLFFTGAGIAFIPCIEVENDEAMFAMPLFRPAAGEFMLAAGRPRRFVVQFEKVTSQSAGLFRERWRLTRAVVRNSSGVSA